MSGLTMMGFEQVESPSYELIAELLPAYLPKIQPDLMILADRVVLHKEDSPFFLLLNKKDKRPGIIEILKPAGDFPGQILSHAAWVTQNSLAISNLNNKNEFNPDLPPFIIGLVSGYPLWINLCSYLKLDMTLLKYSAISHQGNPGLIFEPLFASSILKQDQARQEIVKISPPFRSEGMNEMGLTEAELRYFSN